MKMEVVVTSREIIKPSRPTPNQPRHIQLSFLDQLNSRIFSPCIYFYSSTTSDSDTNLARSEKLKKSLAEALSNLYPIAGRIRDYSYIDCNNEGVEFFEARVAHSLKLSDVFRQSNNQDDLAKFLPYNELIGDAGDKILAIQVSYFDCGGIVIGACFSHKIIDALSVLLFMNSWAAIARSDDSGVISHGFDLANLFPPRKVPNLETQISTAKKISAKVFVFGRSALSALRARYSNSSTRPTRMESLSAFLFSRFVAATRGEDKRYNVFHMVNLRPRLNPPLPNTYLGNLVGFAYMVPLMSVEGYDFVTRTRDAIKKVDAEYVGNLQQGKLQFNSDHDATTTSSTGEVIQFSFSSISNFPVYGADFGWGKPIWMSMCKIPLKNSIVLFPTRSGDGIEALVHLKEDDMAKLESDQEFLAFVSPTTGAKKNQFLSSL